MELRPKQIFVDTNVFLHLHDLKDLPWSDLYPGETSFDLLVCRTVVGELDARKRDDRRRQRNRAIAALKLIEEASGSSDGLIIRDDPILIRILVPPFKGYYSDEEIVLDLQKPDDQIIAELLAHDGAAELLSIDTGPRITARRCGITAPSPPESWLLPKQATKEEKQIKQLESELKLARANRPEICLGFGSQLAPLEHIEWTVPQLPALDLALQDAMIAEHLQCHQKLRLFTSEHPLVGDLSFFTGGLSKMDVERYDRDYSRFEERIQNYFRKLHTSIEGAGLIQVVPFFVSNTSDNTARQLKIELTTDASERVVFMDLSMSGDLGLPDAPKPPEPRSASPHPRLNLDRLNLGVASNHRDPTRFYWEEAPDPKQDFCTLMCEDFRAKETYHNSFAVLSLDEESRAHPIKMKVSASNMSGPRTAEVMLSYTKKPCEWSDTVSTEGLPKWVAQQIKEYYRA